MNKTLYFASLFLALMLFPLGMKAQVYHEDDKEGLRKFLRQSSAEPGKINLEMVPGLALSDTLDWNTSEAWIEKLVMEKFGLWDSNLQSKRLTNLIFYTSFSGQLAGTLDCTLFTELRSVRCSNNQLTRIIADKGSKIITFHCFNNLLRFSTLPLLNLIRNSYAYSPQRAFLNDTIPIEQVIDLSSEYLIHGTNTVYEWVDEENNPLMLNSVGNGMFKADVSLGGKTAICRMTNQTLPQLTQSYTITFTEAKPVQIYHEDDKEGLRRFLRQASANPGKINLEMVPRLALSDTLDWNTSEAWIEKISAPATSYLCFSWNDQQPKRLIRLDAPSIANPNNQFAGILDCTPFAELTTVNIPNNQLTHIIKSKNTKMWYMYCENNLLRFSTLHALEPIRTYSPQKALPTDTISIEQVIDLSSEYQINGINTVYKWVDEAGAPLTLTSAGNGMFKTDAALGGKTITCKMTNQRFYDLTLSYTVVLTPALPVQLYHEDDKEGLRRFLRQPTTDLGQLNINAFGLATSDTLDWNTSEAWVEKLNAVQRLGYKELLSWTKDSQSKRLISLTIPSNAGANDEFAGILDCTLFTELNRLICSGNSIARIIVNENSNITTLYCQNNSFRFSTLPVLDIPFYHYHSQRDIYFSEYIPVGQIIDLSSEYLINGTNTVYEWYDKYNNNSPLTLTSLGNGNFKADAALFGKTIICKMTNPAFPNLTLSCEVRITAALPVQLYHEDDKEGLRRFLRQASAQPGKLNLEWLGLAISDTLEWKTSEEWVKKLYPKFFLWNSDLQSKRLTYLALYSGGFNGQLAGILDCTLFSELTRMECNRHQLTQIIASKDSKIETLSCHNNLLRFSTLPLLDLTYTACIYFPQKALPTDTIPVNQVIDLSSEYQINGVNTVYEWISETGAPLTLTPAGNGTFKADATLEGRTITCRMTNQTFSSLTLEYTVILTQAAVPVQIYHEDEKEGLRRFLRQASAQPKRLNLETLGLVLSDTLEWNVSEAWVEKLNTVLPVGSKEFCSWSNDSQFKRLISLTIPSRAGANDEFAGILDCTLFTELNRLICSGNQLTKIIASENSNISTLYCQNNALRFSTLPLLNIPYYHYHSQAEFPFEFILMEQIIDLSSEYLINGINTVYEWYDEEDNSPLTLTSVGNGMFKADAALVGKVITCQMTNQAFPNLTLSYRFVIVSELPSIYQYHEGDKEGLRRFLRQTSAQPGKLNLEVLGLAISDTLNWEASEEWVDFSSGPGFCTWSYESPRRLTDLMLDFNLGPNNYQFAGILDCTLLTELTVVNCIDNQLTQIIVGEESKIIWLNCPNNVLRFSTLPLLSIPSDNYTYHPQKALPTDTIPVTQVIDLSSEYLIDGTNTVYEWVSVTGAPLTLTPAGNGMFKANAALSGKTITCRMTNQRFPDLTLEYTVAFEEAMPVAYHEADKEGLRRFLRQASAQPGKLNFEAFGLATSDTLQWGTSNEWIEKLNVLNSNNYEYLSWNNQHPKRLSVLRVHYSTSLSYKLAGVLDCSPFTELTRINCNNNLFTQVVVNENSKISYLNCPNNVLRFSTLPLLNKTYIYAPQKALPTDTISVAQVIDLSSEYLINGTNTVYQWIDEVGVPLTLTSAGNGIFKADTTFEGKTITCHMTNQRFPDLTLEYKIVFIESSPEPEVITLIAHLALEESPEKDYYVASSGQRFKIFAQTLLNPDLVRIGLFKSNGGAWIEDITQSRSGYTYTCEISQMMSTNNYMIQAYTQNENGDIQVIERKAQSYTIDKLPFAFVRNALLKYTPAPETIQSHLVLNSSEKNLYCLYIDNPFKVIVNIPVVGGTRIGLFDLFGELVEDVTELVNGKLFTCRMSYNVFPGNYMLLPYKETAQGIQIIERTTGAAVMDRLPVRVDYEWNLRNSAKSKSVYDDITEETEISIYPNPVQHTLHIKANNAIEQIEIYNLQGKVLKKVIQTSEISVTDLSEGMYIIKIYTKNMQTSHMFLKN